MKTSTYVVQMGDVPSATGMNLSTAITSLLTLFSFFQRRKGFDFRPLTGLYLQRFHTVRFCV